MKILIILPRFPYPLEKGDKLRAYHQIKVISKEHEVHLFCICEEQPSQEALSEIQKYCQTISFYIPKRLNIFGNLIKNTLTGRPWQFSFFIFSKAKKIVRDLVDHIQPDHIFCQLIRTADYAEKINIPKTLDYQDAFSLGMLRRVQLSSFPKRWIYRREYKALKRYESYYFDRFEYKIIISDNDRQAINHSHKDRILIVKNGINTDFFKPSEESEKTFDLLFVGHLGYPPNIEAVQFIANEIRPVLKEKCPNIRILIAGASPGKDILGLKNENLDVFASLKDIRDAYNQARIFVAPMFLGSGLQNKLLEAMSMKLPCITTELPNQTLGAVPEQDLLLAQTKEEFVDQILRLLNDKALYEKLQTNGRTFVKAHFSWEKETEKWLNHIS